MAPNLTISLRHYLMVAVMVTIAIWATADQWGSAQAQSSNQTTVDAAKLLALKHKRDALWNQLKELGGKATPKKAIDDVKHRMTTRQLHVDRIEGRLSEMVGSKEALQQMKQEVDDKWVLGFDDAVQQGAEWGTKKALEEAGKKSAGKGLGWVSVVGSIVEYGGLKIIKELNLDVLEELIEQNRINLQDALQLQSALLRDNDDDRKLRNKLTDLMNLYQTSDERYLAEKQRQANLASKNAASTDPKEITDVCSFVPDRVARKACYGMWKKQCPGVVGKKNSERCYATLTAASARGKSGGKLWNICAPMRNKYKQNCYSFGKIVKRLCQMIATGPERSECLKNVATMPFRAAIVK